MGLPDGVPGRSFIVEQPSTAFLFKQGMKQLISLAKAAVRLAREIIPPSASRGTACWYRSYTMAAPTACMLGGLPLKRGSLNAAEEIPTVPLGVPPGLPLLSAS